MKFLPKRILIVEDEIIAQRYLKEIISEMGIPYECVDNSKDALEALREHHYDMILMDINIKGSMDGLRLSKRIVAKNKEICIVYATAYGDDETVEEAIDISSCGFIVKPYTPELVKATIKTIYMQFFDEQKQKTTVETKTPTQKNITDITPNMQFYHDKKILVVNEEPVKLTYQELKFIDLLCININEIVMLENIISSLWEGKVVHSTSLRTLVYNIRKKVPELPLETYNKIGYQLKQEY